MKFSVYKLLQSRVMSPDTDGGAGGAGAGSGAGDNGGGANTTPTEKPPVKTESETVSKAEFEKVMNELHKHKNKAKALEDKANDEKTLRMKEQNQWKELAEANELKAKEAETKAERVQNSYINEKKYSALREKALALGLRPEATSDLEMLDLEPLTVETTNTGRISILGADKFAAQLKTLKPHWFADKSVTNVNTNGTRVLDPSAPVTPELLLAAEKEGRKSGDLSKYHSMFKTYQAQRKSR